jgi:hypothetical protein
VNVSIGRLPSFSSRQQDHRTDDRWFQNFKYFWLEFGVIDTLPPEIAGDASFDGAEYGWKILSFPAALAAAERFGAGVLTRP